MYLFVFFAGLLILIWYATLDPLRKYRKKFGLKRAGLEYSKSPEELNTLQALVSAERSTAFRKSESLIWIYEQNGQPLFLSATKQSRDLRIAAHVSATNKLHFVLDSKANNQSFGVSNLENVNKLPSLNLELEGHFQNKFDVYCEPDRERELLEVLTPDVMLDIFDNVELSDIEIINGQVAMHVVGGAKNAKVLEASIDSFGKLQSLLGSLAKA